MAEKTVDIVLKTTEDLAAAEKAQGSLKKTVDAVKAAGGQTKQYEEALKKLDKALDSETAKQLRAEKALKEYGQVLDKVNPKQKGFSDRIKESASEIPGLSRALTLLKNPIALVAAGMTVLLGILKKSVTSFSEAEIAIAKMDAALNNSGNLTQKVRDDYIALSSEMQNLTAVGDDVWQSVLGSLTQFGATPDNIRQYAMATKDLAGIMAGGGPGSLNNAAILVGKVLQGNTGALSEYGITVDQTLSKSEQIAQVFEKIAAAGGGQLEARAQTLTGRFGQLKNVIGDTFEAVGRLLDKMGVFRPVLDSTIQIFTTWSEILDTTRDKTRGLVDVEKDALQTQAAIAAERERHAKAMQEFAENTQEAVQAEKELQDLLNDQLSLEEKIIQKKKELALAQIRNDDSLTASERARLEIRVEEGAVRATEKVRTTARAAQVAANDQGIATRNQEVATAQAEIDALATQVTNSKDFNAKRNEIQKIRKRIQENEATRTSETGLGETIARIASGDISFIGEQAAMLSARAKGASSQSEIQAVAKEYDRVLQEKLQRAEEELAAISGRSGGRSDDLGNDQQRLGNLRLQQEERIKTTSATNEAAVRSNMEIARTTQEERALGRIDRQIRGEGYREALEDGGFARNRSFVGRGDTTPIESDDARTRDEENIRKGTMEAQQRANAQVRAATQGLADSILSQGATVTQILNELRDRVAATEREIQVANQRNANNRR